jgi:hypothetical protein
MDKWDLRALRVKLDHDDNLDEVYHTLCSLLDLMIDEATKKDDAPDYEPYWGGQD